MRDDGASRFGWTWDLALVVALVAATNVVLLGVEAPRAVVWAVGIPFLLVLPGYAIVAALFPETSDPSRSNARPWDTPGTTVRFGLAMVLSAVVVALVGVALSRAAAIRLLPVVVAISAVTVAGVVIAAIRRWRLRPADRATPLVGDGSALQSFSTGSAFQNAIAVLALVALVGTLAFTGAAPSEGDPYTEFYLLSEDEDGNLTAANYPETFVSGEGQTLHVGIENNEHESKTYEVVTLAQTVSDDGSVVVQQRVDRFDVQLDDGESATLERELAPTIVGDRVRLRVLLYEGEAPENPSAETADQSLHIWVDIVEQDE